MPGTLEVPGRSKVYILVVLFQYLTDGVTSLTGFLSLSGLLPDDNPDRERNPVRDIHQLNLERTVVMLMKEYLLGIDIGTSSCKTIVIDTDGRVIDSARYSYEISCPQYGWAEQNPEDWYQAFRQGLAEIFDKHPEIPKQISAIGVTGQMIGLTLLDQAARVIRPAIIWMDQRCLPQVEYLKERFEEPINRIALNPINMTYTLPKILWVKENEPEVWQKVYKFQLPKDYMRLRLTDVWAVDYHDLSGTLLLDVTNLCWAEEIIDLVGVEREKLPELLPSWNIAGYVTNAAARELGIPAGIPVVAGAGDQATENLAAGIISSDQLLTRLGTAGSSSTCTEFPLPDPKKIAPCYPHCIPGRWLAEIADHTFGLCENWFRETFFSLEKKEAQKQQTDFYHTMDALAEDIPIGAEGLIFHPFNHGGPYWNPQLRGAFYGINLRHNKGHFFPGHAGRQRLLPERFDSFVRRTHWQECSRLQFSRWRIKKRVMDADDL